MAMTILNNTSAMLTLGELNKNISKVGKDLKKVATGQKMSGAGDGASEYAVSEKMRARLRALNQDIQNVQTGSSLVKTADGAIANIVEELRSLKELAINAANDTNTDKDRATIQRDFDKKKENIDEIASETNYNGKILLDGRWRRGNTKTEKTIIPETNTKTENITETYEETYTILQPRTSKAVRPSAAVPTGVAEPESDVTTITGSSNYTIWRDGKYSLSDYTGTITIMAKNVELTQRNSTRQLSNVYIVGPSSGGANLWIDGLNVKNSQDKSFINFRGTDNVLTLKGENKITPHTALGYISAVIHIGDGLTIEGSGSINFHETTEWCIIAGSMIGTNAYEKSNADLTINSGTITMTSDYSTTNNEGGYRTGAAIGAGRYSSMGNITINGGTFDLMTYGGGACIGGGGYDGSVGNISIQNATIKAWCDDGACIGSGANEGSSYISAGDIYILNSSLDLTCDVYGYTNIAGAGTGAGIGSGAAATVGDITVENCTAKIVSNRGACIGTGGIVYDRTPEGTPRAGIITIIDSSLDLTTRDSRAETIGRGLNGVIPDPDEEEEVTITETKTRTRTVTSTETTYTEQENKILIPAKPLAIHHGPKAHQALNIFFKDMRTKAMNLDDVSVTTRKNATDAIGKVDAAIEYALDEATNVGAYLSRLEYTAANLTTASENTQASESTIRDADMARAMTDYTKSNVLTQAAQSMLAQANQNGSAVLSLLQ